MRIPAFLALAVLSTTALAQRGGGRGNPLAPYTKIDTAVVALTHARVIDGTGAAVKTDQTIIIRDGLIERVGPSASTPVPAGVQTIDATGKSVMPGLVMVHEHLYYPNGGGWYGNYDESFTRNDELSLSGRMIAPIAQRVYAQWPELASATGTRFAGNLFVD